MDPIPFRHTAGEVETGRVRAENPPERGTASPPAQPIVFSMHSRLVAAVTAVVLLAPTAVAGAHAARGASNSRIVAAINHERVANGLPAVTENAAWSSRCRAHNDYMARNHAFGHVQDPALPGASAAGRWAAGNSILSGGSWLDGNPYANAPLHLIQLMSPLLTSVGVDEHGGYTCTTTWPGFATGSGPRPGVYSYPGDGATSVPAAEAAAEFPFTPAQVLGLARVTGFNVMVWAVGLDGPRIASARMTGPGGVRVPLRTVDETQPALGRYLGPGAALLIPAAPLAPGTRYRASVTFAGTGGGSASRTWHFTTASSAAVDER
jgi:hypothetical protein